MYCESYQTYDFRNFGGSSTLTKVYFIQESRMRENLTYGLTRGQEKHVDDTLERDTHPKGEKNSRGSQCLHSVALLSYSTRTLNRRDSNFFFNSISLKLNLTV